jgi:hypothetical protein
MSFYAILYKVVDSGRIVHKRALVEAETKEAACESLEALAPGGAVFISGADEVFTGTPDFVITRNR